MVWKTPAEVADYLATNHYLGPAKRGVAWEDEYGCMVLASPTNRHLPTDWLELTRWCLRGEKNAGSRQWSAVRKALLRDRPTVTTVVSYSDPSVGHTGALYRACNWVWAPTWHRLRPPPSGNGSWVVGKVEAVKDRWVAPLRADSRRAEILVAKDEAILKRMPWARYQDPVGANYKAFREIVL